jgi:hypothetical protein
MSEGKDIRIAFRDRYHEQRSNLIGRATRLRVLEYDAVR